MLLRTSDGHWRPDFCWGITWNNQFWQLPRPGTVSSQYPKPFGTAKNWAGRPYTNRSAPHWHQSPTCRPGLCGISDHLRLMIFNYCKVDRWCATGRLTLFSRHMVQNIIPTKIKQDMSLDFLKIYIYIHMLHVYYIIYVYMDFCWIGHEALRHWRWYSIPLTLALVANHGRVKLPIHPNTLNTRNKADFVHGP